MIAPKPLEKVDEIRSELKHLIDRIPEPSAMPLAPPDVKIVFVAVHGVGDQFRFETIQSVSYAVCRYVGQPAAMPLGHYHSDAVEVSGAYVPLPLRDPEVKCGFAEMYWADVPRESVDEKYTLEETRKWARNIAARLDLLARRAMSEEAKKIHSTSADLENIVNRWRQENRHENELIENMLEEVIQGVTIADRLAFVAEKAGLFKFELKKLLLDYVDDIQVVTEFQTSRERLVKKFSELMERISTNYGNARIYVVAHSEGTVVSFLGLLRGLREAKDDKAHWTTKVRGVMTIGSPLNKHVKLWPELFSPENLTQDYVDRDDGKRLATNEKGQALTPPDEENRIPWRNYYDHGDPIGFDLGPTRAWMADHGWEPFFEFGDGAAGDDIGFTRYPFPGVAHNGYWHDKKVFGHFLATVVDPEAEILKPADANAAKILKDHSRLHGTEPETRDQLVIKLDKHWRPLDDAVAKITSYVLPYLASAVLLLIGVYLLYKSIRAYLVPLDVQFETFGQVATDVLGLAALVAGVSLLARIPCLTPRLTIRDLRMGKPEALNQDLSMTQREAQRETRRGALAALGWRSLAVLLALLSLGYLAVSEPNRISVERFLVGPGPAGNLFSFDRQGWYGVKSFEVGMLALILLLWAIVKQYGGERLRPPLRVLVPSSIAWVAARIWLAWPRAQAEPLPATFPLDFSSPTLIPAIAIGLAIWLLASSRLIDGRHCLRRFLAVALALALVLAIYGSSRGTLAAVRIREASLAFVVLTWFVGGVAWWVGRRFPGFGARPLIHTGGLLLLVLIGFGLFEGLRPSAAKADRRDAELQVRDRMEKLTDVMKAHPAWVRPAEGEPAAAQAFRTEAAEVASLQRLIEVAPSHGPIFPVIVSAPVFLYLWWLAMMTFDLTFIWHLYVRYNGARHYVKAMIARAAKMEHANPDPPTHQQQGVPQ